MPYADIEKRRAYVREHRRKWRLEHPEEAKRAYGKFQERLRNYTPEQRREKLHRRRIRNKVRAFLVLGGKCRMCGETDFRLLTLNHINGDGSKDKALNTERRYCQIKNFERDDLELLCYNCQTLYEWERQGKNYSKEYQERLIKELKDHKVEQNW